jgi:sugar (pentulose or hexulose) kinase
LKADIYGIPLRLPKVTEATILAAVGGCAYASLKTAAKTAVHFDWKIEPNPCLQKAYQG